MASKSTVVLAVPFLAAVLTSAATAADQKELKFEVSTAAAAQADRSAANGIIGTGATHPNGIIGTGATHPNGIIGTGATHPNGIIGTGATHPNGIIGTGATHPNGIIGTGATHPN